MNPPDLTHAVWRKSTRSGDNGGQCVEVAFLGSAVGLRDSKNAGEGTVLILSQGGWQAFIASAVGGELGRA